MGSDTTAPSGTLLLHQIVRSCCGIIYSHPETPPPHSLVSKHTTQYRSNAGTHSKRTDKKTEVEGPLD